MNRVDKVNILTRIGIGIMSFAIPVLVCGRLEAQNPVVYEKSSEVAKLSKTPKGITLRSARGSEEAFTIRASLAEVRLANSASKGDAGGVGKLNVLQKFLRIEFSGVSTLASPAEVKLTYLIEEGSRKGRFEETIKLKTKAPNFTLDTGGFKDKAGTEVKSKTSGNTITSTKYKHDSAEIIGVLMTIADGDGNKLFSAGWPEASSDLVILPEHLQPRTFTSTDGKKVNGTLIEVSEDTASLKIKGRQFDIPLTKLSEADRKYLKQFQPGL